MMAVAAECPACGGELVKGGRFCAFCGVVLGAGPEERRVVTVIFADVVGFTSYAEEADPEAVKAMLDRCFAVMTPVVEGSAGRVDKVVGDEMMATFGTPVSRADDPERAVLAALELHQAVADQGLALRIGINTGEVLAGRVGPGRTPTVTGDVVNTAHRLASAARTGQTMVGEGTWLATRQAVDYQRLSPLRLRGKRERVAAWIALRPAASVDSGLANPGPTVGDESPIIGRDGELAILGRLARAAFDGHRPTLMIAVGEGGVGKSRLGGELRAELWTDLESGLFLRAICPKPPTRPMAAMAQILAQAFGIAQGGPDGADALMAGLAAACPETDDEDRAALAESLESLLAVGHGASSETAPATAGGRAWAGRTEEVIGTTVVVVEGLSRAQPTVVVIDDLHRADDDLLETLARLVSRGQPVPLFILGLARPELRARLATRRDWPGEWLEVSPLADDDADALVRSVIQSRDDADRAPTEVDTDTVAELVAATGGNPYFTEELVAYLVDNHRLARQRGTWSMIESESDRPIPATIRAVIDQRLDTLGPETFRVLSAIAIVGPNADIDLVARVAGVDDVAEALAGIRALGILAGPDGDLFFRHDLTRDVARARMTLDERVSMHLTAANVLANRPEASLTIEDQLGIADHFDEAVQLGQELGQIEPALHRESSIWLARTGAMAARQDALVDADRRYRRARELWATAGVEPGDAGGYDLVLIDILIGHGGVLIALRGLDEAIDVLGEARRRAEGCGDGRRMAQATTRLGMARHLSGDGAEADRHFADATQVWKSLGDDAGEVDTLLVAAQADLVAGWTTRAEARLAQVASIEIQDPHIRAITAQLQGWSAFLRGDLGAARLHLETAASRFQESHDVKGLAWCAGIQGFALAHEGRLREALAIAENLIVLAERRGDPYGGALCRMLAVQCRIESGELDRAEAELADARSGFNRLDDTWGQGMAYLATARIAIERDAAKLAVRAVDDGLAAAAKVGDLGTTARLHVARAEADASRARWRGAESSARAALELMAEGVGDLDSSLRARMVLGRAAVGQGQHEQAVAVLEKAFDESPSEPNTTTRRALAGELARLLAGVPGRLDRARHLVDIALDDEGESLRSWVAGMHARLAVLEALGDEARLTTARAELLARTVPADGPTRGSRQD